MWFLWFYLAHVGSVRINTVHTLFMNTMFFMKQPFFSYADVKEFWLCNTFHKSTFI